MLTSLESMKKTSPKGLTVIPIDDNRRVYSLLFFSNIAAHRWYLRGACGFKAAMIVYFSTTNFQKRDQNRNKFLQMINVQKIQT